ncbi:hypothetical protein BGW42_006563 [Actinomortierella wolfii]|nr:hypothetical protein BGW42_006563 [Actinomortierella wolfii]
MGVLNTSLTCFVISSLSCFALWYPAHNYLLLVVFMFMYGVFAGGLFILLPVAATQIVGQERLPMALGITFVANALGGLVGSPISDAVVKASGGDNWWAILFTGLTLVVSTALCAALRFTMRRSI